MADDQRLLELLGDALIGRPAEPSPVRVAAVRRLAAARGAQPTVVPPQAACGIVDIPTQPPKQRVPPTIPPRRPLWGWLASGVAVVAAVLVIAFLTVPASRGGRGGSGHSWAAGPEGPVGRLRGALRSQNAVAVAVADTDLLRQAGTLDDSERTGAVAAHVAAVQFLRDHPSPDALAQVASPAPGASREEPTPAPRTDTSVPAQVQDTIAPAGEASTAPRVPTTVGPGARSVTILDVVALLDGTFQLDFSVAGFVPDASGLPGTHAVRFSFDGGESPTTWAGPSPWSFPVSAGVAFHQVCAHVVDAAGVEDVAGGGCHDIA